MNPNEPFSLCAEPLLSSHIESLSVVIPAFNEESRLPATLMRVAAFLLKQGLRFSEIIVIDDGSTDRTLALTREFIRNYPGNAHVFSNPQNSGKGFSVRHGMLKASGDWILMSDADESSPISQVLKLAEKAVDDHCAVVIGSRALDPSLVGVHQSAFRELCGRFFNACMRQVLHLPFRDTQCGFKLFRNDAAKQIFPRQRLAGFSFDVETLVLADKLRFATAEVPVVWNNVAGTTVRGFSGIASFADLIRIRRLHRDFKPNDDERLACIEVQEQVGQETFPD